jgi:AhpD family alkylhydroperoxidase
LKKKTKKTKESSLSFRSLVNPRNVTNPESRRIYEELVRDSGKVPEIYRVRALADNTDWLKLLDKCIFRWPQSCSLDEKTKELIGLAKSIAFFWEPGVLTNIEGALEAGATSSEITEAILVASTVSGLANVEAILLTASAQLTGVGSVSSTNPDGPIQELYDDARKIMGLVPEFYRTKLMVENPDWLAAIHQSTKIQYSEEILDRRTKALVCLAASAAKGWDRGVREHSSLALKSGATIREITDVLASVYKTTASISIQVGFGVPCSIPEIQGFKLLRDYYSKRKSRGPHKVRSRR